MKRALALAVLEIALWKHPVAAAPTTTITFDGNVGIESRDLLAAIDPPFDASGGLQQEIFERDLLLISAYYWDRGYANVRVGEPKFAPLSITIPIEEGPIFTIADVHISGDPPEAARKAHLAAIHVRPNDTFSRTTIADDRETLARFYEDRGFAYVEVLPLTKVDLAQRTIALTFEIKRGKHTTIERVELDNTTRVPDATLRRALKLAAGDPYSTSRLLATKRALQQFARGDVFVSTKHGSTDGQIVVRIELSDD